MCLDGIADVEVGTVVDIDADLVVDDDAVEADVGFGCADSGGAAVAATVVVFGSAAQHVAALEADRHGSLEVA